MTENSAPSDAGGPLPPKLDLRRIGVKGETAKPAPAPAPAPAAKPAPKPTAKTPAPSQPEVLKAPSAETIPIEPAPTSPKLAAPTQPQTIHIKIPKVPTVQTERGQPQVVQPPQTAATVHPPAQPKKKETTKIPLEAATQPPTPTVTAAPSAEAPKTIRIKPKAPTAQTQKMAQPAVLSPTPSAAGPGATTPLPGADKKKTSRISLEAALVADADQEKLLGAKGPKTIRLQRPGAAATVKMGGTPPAPQAAPAPAPATQATDRTPMVPTAVSFEETTQIEAPPVAPAEPSGTQRKTIRVKRPTLKPGVTTLPGQTIGVAPGAVDAYRVSAAARAPVVRPDLCNATFPVFAIITLLIVMVTIYMFCSQAFGPNACLTEYSYAKEGPNLAWPGKIPVYHQQ